MQCQGAEWLANVALWRCCSLYVNPAEAKSAEWPVNIDLLRCCRKYSNPTNMGYVAS